MSMREILTEKYNYQEKNELSKLRYSQFQKKRKSSLTQNFIFKKH